MPLILALGRQRQEELCKFEASLVNIASSRTARAIQKNPVSENQTKPNQTNKIEQNNWHNQFSKKEKYLNQILYWAKFTGLRIMIIKQLSGRELTVTGKVAPE